nr:MAG TPA: hypothetical protein [Caudoviricetes sp.]DAN52752.1 MAG TPA: hypothetical protein [Caudoviricetes sp.]
MLNIRSKSQCECRSHCHSNNTSYQFISQCKHFSSVGSQKVGNNFFCLNIHSQIVGQAERMAQFMAQHTVIEIAMNHI